MELSRRDFIKASGAGIGGVFIDPNQFETREEFDAELVRVLKKYGVDLVLLAGYMKILTKPFTDAFKMKAMNIHPALLPAFMGSTHAQWDAVEHGVKVSGCTVHFVTDDVDGGPIIVQRAVPVEEGDTGQALADKIIKFEHEIYPEAVRLFVEGKLKVEGRVVHVLE